VHLTSKPEPLGTSGIHISILRAPKKKSISFTFFYITEERYDFFIQEHPAVERHVICPA
jgi:hypothetical protein